jgi:hypothetical protein
MVYSCMAPGTRPLPSPAHHGRVAMEQYKTYLRGELAKFGGAGDAKFLASGKCGVEVVGPPLSVDTVVEGFTPKPTRTGTPSASVIRI